MLGAATMANDSVATFVVNPTGLGTSTGPGNSYTFYGYAAAASTLSGTGPFAAFYPSSAMGTATPGTIRGATIVGVYSVYVDPATTGTSYIVTVSGDWTATPGIINGVTVNGTLVNSGKVVTYFGTNNTTRFEFSTSAITSLFFPSGSSKTVVIA